jgi:hypothetical protein
MTEETRSFDNWTGQEWKDQFRTLRANELGPIFETGKYVEAFRKEFRAHPERWGDGAQWSTVCPNITGLSNSTCSMYETVWRVLGSLEATETYDHMGRYGWNRDRLPTSLRTLYHIARAFEINPGTISRAMTEDIRWGLAHPKYNPIHPDMSRTDAEDLVKEAEAVVDILKMIEDMGSLQAKFEKDWLGAGISQTTIESLTWEPELLADIYTRRQDKEYMAETEAALALIVKGAEAKMRELVGQEGI